MCRACYIEVKRDGGSGRGRLPTQAEFKDLFLVRATELRRIVAETKDALLRGCTRDDALAILGKAEDFDALHKLREVRSHGETQADTG